VGLAIDNVSEAMSIGELILKDGGGRPGSCSGPR
jgi:hypothetical protein